MVAFVLGVVWFYAVECMKSVTVGFGWSRLLCHHCSAWFGLVTVGEDGENGRCLVVVLKWYRRLPMGHYMLLVNGRRMVNLFRSVLDDVSDEVSSCVAVWCC